MNKIFAICLLLAGCSFSPSDAADYRVMVFSATHCAPCKQYELVVKQLQAEGWPILLYKDQHGLAQSYGVAAYPTTLVINTRTNKVVWTHTGYIDINTARQYLTRYKNRLK